MTMTMKICLLPQIFTILAKQMQDINTSEKASNSNLPLIISMVKGAWSRSLWAPISVIRKKIFHFEGAENRKKGAWWGKNDIVLSTLGSGVNCISYSFNIYKTYNINFNSISNSKFFTTIHQSWHACIEHSKVGNFQQWWYWSTICL